jgi:hypothetical protein
MGSYNYSCLEGRADSLITRFGTAMTLTRTTETPDGVKPWIQVRTTTDYTVQGVRTEYTDREIDGTAVQAQDYKILLAAKDLSIVPEPDDTLTDGSTVTTIVRVRRVHPGDTDLVYTCQVRK